MLIAGRCGALKESEFPNFGKRQLRQYLRRKLVQSIITYRDRESNNWEGFVFLRSEIIFMEK